MPKYHYNATTQSGLKKEGTLIAASLDSAKDKLKEDHLIIISLLEEKKFITHFWEKPALSFQEKMLFTRHMATMIKTGVTITESLEIIANQTKNKNNKKMFETILDMLRNGQNFSKSLKSFDYIFSEIFINMVATGEESGNLEEVFERLSVQMEKEYEIRRKVVAAFIYPAIIMGLTMIITIGIVVFIMPRVTKIFQSFKMDLPAITQALISFSDFLTKKPFIALAVFGGSITFLITVFRLKQLKPFWHMLILHTPFFGKIIVYSNLARFSRTMNSLLQSGVPVVKALKTIGGMIGNHSYSKKINEAVNKVQHGARLGESLEGDENLFPELITKMIIIGEKTGNLEVTMERLADLYERNVDAISRNLSTMLEPILLIFMAGLVGSIVLAIILPIYQLPSLLKQ